MVQDNRPHVVQGKDRDAGQDKYFDAVLRIMMLCRIRTGNTVQDEGDA